MKVLVIAHAKNGQINSNLANVLTAASKISSHCDVLLVGTADVTEVSKLECVSKVLNFNAIADGQNLSSYVANAVAGVVKNYSHVLTAADSYGKDLLPRVAGVLDLSQISEVVAIVSPNIFKKPMYAGNVLVEVESFEDTKLLTVRATSFAAYRNSGVESSVETLNDVAEINPSLSYVGETMLHSDTIDLSHAQIIVSGGYSLGSKESFDELIHGLAVKLGGAVGASRAAVDAGYANNDCQVGQTGKIVAPKLYLAIGVSGAVQHIAGMKDSQQVIAVNIDPNAQIFEYADYGLVGDLFEIVPELINKLS